MANIVEQAPKIIAEASKSPLGVVSLALLALSVVGYLFFGDSSEPVRVSMYVLMFSGYGLLCFNLIRRSSLLQNEGGSGGETSAAADDTALQPSQPVATEVQRASPSVGIKRTGAANKIDTTKALRKLALLWYAWSSFLLVILALQSVFGRYGEGVEQAWAWISVSLIPTISVVMASQTAEGISDRISVSSLSLWRLCFYLSLAYLSLVTGVVIFEPFFTVEPLKLLNASNLLLAPMQGVLLALMIYFLLSREEMSRVQKKRTPKRAKNRAVENKKRNGSQAPNTVGRADG